MIFRSLVSRAIPQPFVKGNTAILTIARTALKPGGRLLLKPYYVCFDDATFFPSLTGEEGGNFWAVDAHTRR